MIHQSSVLKNSNYYYNHSILKQSFINLRLVSTMSNCFGQIAGSLLLSILLKYFDTFLSVTMLATSCSFINMLVCLFLLKYQ